MLKHFLVPDDQFFAKAMRSPQGRKRLEIGIRKARTLSIFLGVSAAGFLAFISSKVAANIILQIKFPDQNISASIHASLFFFALFVPLICLSLVRWHTLTTELKFIAAWPFSPTGQNDELANTATAAGKEVKP